MPGEQSFIHLLMSTLQCALVDTCMYVCRPMYLCICVFIRKSHTVDTWVCGIGLVIYVKTFMLWINMNLAVDCGKILNHQK